MALDLRHVGPSAASFSPSLNHSFSGRILALARAPESARMYAGTFAGVWRSDDAGRTWRQMTRPQPPSGDFDVPGALFAPHVHTLAVSPLDPDLVLAAGRGGGFSPARDGLYRSVDGGVSWALVLPASDVISHVAFAPDDALLVFAAAGNGGVGVSTDAGATWVARAVAGRPLHLAVGPQESPGVRRLYAAGDNRIFTSGDGGTTWRADAGAATVRTALDEIWNRYVRNPPVAPPVFAAGSADSNGSAGQILAIDPQRPRGVYLATVSGANGPGYYMVFPDGTSFPDGTIRNVPPAPGAGEASLWHGDFDGFEATGSARWTQLPGPPLYFGVTTPSGDCYVTTKRSGSGHLVFFSDNSHVHVSEGRPTATSSWHRLDGMDVSEAHQKDHSSNQIFMHADPHDLVVTGDFELTLEPPSGVSAPYDQCSVLEQHVRGTMWMANDGGVVFSEDGGRTWTRAAGLETIDAVNLAGLHRPGRAPALYMGVVDNDDFFTLDGGESWGDPITATGDGDTWFADPALRRRVLAFDPRNDRLVVFTNPFPQFFSYPDVGSPLIARGVGFPRNGNTSSGAVTRGYRPVIQTLAGEAPPADGDYVVIADSAAGERVLLRTRSISSISTVEAWDDPARAEPIGPPLPTGANLVQAGGGHAATVFYVSDNLRLWTLDVAAGAWRMVVPGGPPGRTAGRAKRFYVHPYEGQVVYIVDDSAIKVTTDGGETWLVDTSLTAAATAGGQLTLGPAVLRDMVFVGDEPFTVFALGNAGVSYTLDGVQWFTLLSSLALPGRPEGGFFDPGERALYVALEGRSVMRIGGVPAPAGGPQPSFGLLEFAAIADA